jgi:hypothetical protein
MPRYGPALNEPHFTGTCTNCVQQEPSPPDAAREPAVMLLVGSLLSGLGVFGRKKFINILKD